MKIRWKMRKEFGLLAIGSKLKTPRTFQKEECLTAWVVLEIVLSKSPLQEGLGCVSLKPSLVSS